MTRTEDGPAKVMIVEDSADLAMLFEGWLEETYTVEVAHNCAAAYELLDETVDVALLDRQLPDGSGDEVLKHVRQAEYDCRVAMVTAVDPGFDIIEMGFDDYLRKPATKEELQNTVDRLLAHTDYGEAIQELYALSSKKALLEAAYTAEELTANDEYTALAARIVECNEQLDKLVENFSARQFSVEYARLRARGTND